jgi:hypothetical protein
MKQMTNLLGLYGGCDSDELKRIRKLPSRWVALCTTFPSLVIYEGGCYLLHSSNEKEEKPASKLIAKRGSGIEDSYPPSKRSRDAAGGHEEEKDGEDEYGY